MGVLSWLMRMRVFAGQCCDVRVLHPYALAAALYLIRSLGSVRSCPGSACISFVWVQRCNTSPSLSLSAVEDRQPDATP